MLYVFFPVAVILAAFSGYIFGKRQGKKIVTDEKNLANYPLVGLNRKLNYNEPHMRGNHFIQKFEMVTVMLADIEGFSEITDHIDPEKLMDELNGIFFFFDSRIDRYQVEKIKTMGDAYMCAGGILYKNHTNPMDVVLLAMDVQNHQKKNNKNKNNEWKMRIGIHTGPVIAGMLGQKKLAFDIWGHTVNVTARLEASCKPGKICISGVTYEKIKDYFDCEYHGIAPRTEEHSYFVTGLKPEFVEINKDGELVPNNAFFIKMQLLRLVDLEEHIVHMMTNTATNMYFHNVKHALDVCMQVEILSQSENVTDEDVLLLKTAALMHDIGYTISYENDISHVSEEIAREFLPTFQYKPFQIDRICKLIKAANYESIPKDIVEEVMHDANYIYFGQDNYIEITMSLLRELEEHTISVNRTQWFKTRIHKLQNHKYYTQTAKNMIKVPVDEQIARLEKIVNSE